MNWKAKQQCWLWAALLMCCSAAAQENATAARCSSAETVLQRYIDALGGAAAIQQVTSLTTEADETEPCSFKPQDTASYQYRFEWKAPNKVSFRSKHVGLGLLGVGSTRHFIFNGQEWSDYRGRGLPPQRNEQPWRRALMFDYLHNAMWRIAADPLMIARPEELYSNFEIESDRRTDPDLCIVRARGKDRRNDILYFDAQSGLLIVWALQMVQPRNSFYLRIEFRDYRQLGAVKFPFSLYFDFYHASYQYKKVVLNPQLKDSDFELKR